RLIVDLRGCELDSVDGRCASDFGPSLVVSRAQSRFTDERWMDFDHFEMASVASLSAVSNIVLILARKMSARDWCVIGGWFSIAAATKHCRVCIVSSFSCHFDDKRSVAAEASASEMLRRAGVSEYAILRPGNVVKEPGSSSLWTRFLSALHPLVSSRLK